MAEARAALKAVDRVEITTLVDNSIDVFLPSTKRFGGRKCPRTCHGESASRLFPSTATRR